MVGESWEKGRRARWWGGIVLAYVTDLINDQIAANGGRVDGQRLSIRLSNNQIARAVGTNKRQVQTSLRQLRDQGLIEVTQEIDELGDTLPHEIILVR